jgi:plastocyanin
MLFSVKALSPADFNTWLQTQIKSAAAAPSAAAPSGGSGAPGASGGAGAPGGPTVDLTAHNVTFEQASLEAPASKPFVINFTNNDAGVSHNVQITDGTGQVVFKGEIFSGPGSRQYPVPALAAGTYTFACSVHPTMTGTLTVK